MDVKVILSHSGKQHAYHLAKSLLDLGLLEKFITSSYVASPFLQKLLLQRNNKFWTRRFLSGLGGDKVESNWRFEFKEMLYSKLFGLNEKTLNAVYERDVKFDHFLARKMSRQNGNVFWGFQGSCLESLRAARKNRKVAICELASIHVPFVKRMMEEEKQLHPEWADSIDNRSFPEAYYKRLCSEPHQADVVVGASEFTLQTLREDNVPTDKLRKLPLGFEIEHIPYAERPAQNGPVRLLYAGRITQRKGIKYLLEAMQSIDPKDAELHIIGHSHGSGVALKKYDHYILHQPLQQYDLFRRYQEFDALVLPSIFEGFGLVIVEAMAAGLPVITTPNTIGPEMIQHGENGFIVPIRDVSSIVGAVKELIRRTGDERSAMRRKARASALQFSWEAYKKRLPDLLATLPD
jgi:glycosyltransferase involved in cell wall biosynthesis